MKIKDLSPTDAPEARAVPDSRVRDAELLPLVEIAPELVVDKSIAAPATLAEAADAGGSMRESCPYCPDEPLQLVLRRQQVIRSHLYCRHCARCFDAILPDGSSAFDT